MECSSTAEGFKTFTLLIFLFRRIYLRNMLLYTPICWVEWVNVQQVMRD